jgi:hypothetical protein
MSQLSASTPNFAQPGPCVQKQFTRDEAVAMLDAEDARADVLARQAALPYSRSKTHNLLDDGIINNALRAHQPLLAGSHIVPMTQPACSKADWLSYCQNRALTYKGLHHLCAWHTAIGLSFPNERVMRRFLERFIDYYDKRRVFHQTLLAVYSGKERCTPIPPCPFMSLYNGIIEGYARLDTFDHAGRTGQQWAQWLGQVEDKNNADAATQAVNEVAIVQAPSPPLRTRKRPARIHVDPDIKVGRASAPRENSDERNERELRQLMAELKIEEDAQTSIRGDGLPELVTFLYEDMPNAARDQARRHQEWVAHDRTLPRPARPALIPRLHDRQRPNLPFDRLARNQPMMQTFFSLTRRGEDDVSTFEGGYFDMDVTSDQRPMGPMVGEAIPNNVLIPPDRRDRINYRPADTRALSRLREMPDFPGDPEPAPPPRDSADFDNFVPPVSAVDLGTATYGIIQSRTDFTPMVNGQPLIRDTVLDVGPENLDFEIQIMRPEFFTSPATDADIIRNYYHDMQVYNMKYRGMRRAINAIQGMGVEVFDYDHIIPLPELVIFPWCGPSYGTRVDYANRKAQFDRLYEINKEVQVMMDRFPGHIRRVTQGAMVGIPGVRAVPLQLIKGLTPIRSKRVRNDLQMVRDLYIKVGRASRPRTFSEQERELWEMVAPPGEPLPGTETKEQSAPNAEDQALTDLVNEWMEENKGRPTTAAQEVDSEDEEKAQDLLDNLPQDSEEEDYEEMIKPVKVPKPKKVWVKKGDVKKVVAKDEDTARHLQDVVNLAGGSTAFYEIDGVLYSVSALMAFMRGKEYDGRVTFKSEKNKSDWRKVFKQITGSPPPQGGESQVQVDMKFLQNHAPAQVREMISEYRTRLDSRWAMMPGVATPKFVLRTSHHEEDDEPNPAIVGRQFLVRALVPTPVMVMYTAEQHKKGIVPNTSVDLEQVPPDERVMRVIYGLSLADSRIRPLMEEVYNTVNNFPFGGRSLTRAMNRLVAVDEVNKMAKSCWLSKQKTGDIVEMFDKCLEYDEYEAPVLSREGHQQFSTFIANYQSTVPGPALAQAYDIPNFDAGRFFNLDPQSSAGLYYCKRVGDLFDFKNGKIRWVERDQSKKRWVEPAKGQEEFLFRVEQYYSAFKYTRDWDKDAQVAVEEYSEDPEVRAILREMMGLGPEEGTDPEHPVIAKTVPELVTERPEFDPMVVFNYQSILAGADRVLDVIGDLYSRIVLSANNADEQEILDWNLRALTISKMVVKPEAIAANKPQRFIWAQSQFVQWVLLVLFKIWLKKLKSFNDGGFAMKDFCPVRGGIVEFLYQLTDNRIKVKGGYISVGVYSDNGYDNVTSDAPVDTPDGPRTSMYTSNDASKMEASHTRPVQRALAEHIAHKVFGVPKEAMVHKPMTKKQTKEFVKSFQSKPEEEKSKPQHYGKYKPKGKNWAEAAESEEQDEFEDKLRAMLKDCKLDQKWLAALLLLWPACIDSTAILGKIELIVRGMPSGVGPTFSANTALMILAYHAWVEELKRKDHITTMMKGDFTPKIEFFARYGIKIKVESVLYDLRDRLALSDTLTDPECLKVDVLGYDLLHFGRFRAPSLARDRLIRSLAYRKPSRSPLVSGLSEKVLEKVATIGRMNAIYVMGGCWDINLSKVIATVADWAKFELRGGQDVDSLVKDVVVRTMMSATGIDEDTAKSFCSVFLKYGLFPSAGAVAELMLDVESAENFKEMAKPLGDARRDAPAELFGELPPVVPTAAPPSRLLPAIAHPTDVAPARKLAQPVRSMFPRERGDPLTQEQEQGMLAQLQDYVNGETPINVGSMGELAKKVFSENEPIDSKTAFKLLMNALKANTAISSDSIDRSPAVVKAAGVAARELGVKGRFLSLKSGSERRRVSVKPP